MYWLLTCVYTSLLTAGREALINRYISHGFVIHFPKLIKKHVSAGAEVKV